MHAPTEPVPEADIRCSTCKKLLAKLDREHNALVIKCSRCHAFTAAFSGMGDVETVVGSGTEG